MKGSSIAAVMLALAAAGRSTAQWYQGPSGPRGGQPFDGWTASQHLRHLAGVNVHTTPGSKAIICVTAEYAPEGPGTTAAALIGPRGCLYAKDYNVYSMTSKEYILGVGGTFTDHVTSLTFYTNKRNIGPIGEGRIGQVFGYTAPTGQMIVAFQESNDALLRSFGVMYAPCDRTQFACR